MEWPFLCGRGSSGVCLTCACVRRVSDLQGECSRPHLCLPFRSVLCLERARVLTAEPTRPGWQQGCSRGHFDRLGALFALGYMSYLLLNSSPRAGSVGLHTQPRARGGSQEGEAVNIVRTAAAGRPWLAGVRRHRVAARPGFPSQGCGPCHRQGAG